jgi:hypothetical protein
VGDVTCIRTSFEIKRGADDGECIVLESPPCDHEEREECIAILLVLFVQIPLGIRAKGGLGGKTYQHADI